MLSTELYREREINPWKREKRKSQRDEGRIFMLAVITAVGFCITWHSGSTKGLAALNGLKFVSSV